MENMKKITTVRNNLVYENKFVSVFDDDVQFPSGHEGTYFRYRWKAPYGVAIVPVIGQNILLVKNYRYAELALSVEVPQGFGTYGKSPKEDAQRELTEETGLLSTSIDKIFITGSDFKTYVFLAKIAQDQTPNINNVETTESINGFLYLNISDINATTLEDFGIFDPITICSLLSVKLMLTPR